MNEITLEWFFELPGLFITGGILLILIALVVFIISASKSKRNDDTSNLKIDSDVSNNAATVSEPIASDVPNVGGFPPVEHVSTPSNVAEVVTEPVAPLVQETPEIVTPIGVEPINVGTSAAHIETPIVTPIEPVLAPTPVVPVEPISVEAPTVITPEVKHSIPVEPVVSSQNITSPTENITEILPVVEPVKKEGLTGQSIEPINVEVPTINVAPQVPETPVINVPEQPAVTPIQEVATPVVDQNIVEEI